MNTNKTLCVDLSTKPKSKKEDTEKNIHIEKERKKRVITTTKKWIQSELESDLELDYIRQIKEMKKTFEPIQVDTDNKIQTSSKKNEIMNIILKQIQYKLTGYKAQDMEKNKFSPEEFAQVDDVVEKMWECKNQCFYCKKTIKILYDFVREPKQWTLDRIDNEYGHNKTNVKIACLQCNIRRKTMYHERYVFTKQLTVTKEKI